MINHNMQNEPQRERHTQGEVNIEAEAIVNTVKESWCGKNNIKILQEVLKYYW